MTSPGEDPDPPATVDPLAPFLDLQRCQSVISKGFELPSSGHPCSLLLPVLTLGEELLSHF